MTCSLDQSTYQRNLHRSFKMTPTFCWGSWHIAKKTIFHLDLSILRLDLLAPFCRVTCLEHWSIPHISCWWFFSSWWLNMFESSIHSSTWCCSKNSHFKKSANKIWIQIFPTKILRFQMFHYPFHRKIHHPLAPKSLRQISQGTCHPRLPRSERFFFFQSKDLQNLSTPRRTPCCGTKLGWFWTTSELGLKDRLPKPPPGDLATLRWKRDLQRGPGIKSSRIDKPPNVTWKSLPVFIRDFEGSC